MEVPEVRYARSGDGHIAYQVFGEGPDLVITPSGFNHLLLRWELPATARMLRRLAGFSRVILWDKRGTGMSDRHGSVPTLDAQNDDLQAVLDTIGSERASHFGTADGSSLSCFYAASFPERTRSLILYGPVSRFAPGDDGTGATPEFLELLRSGAQPEEMLELISPSSAGDPSVREWWRRNSMMSASPGTVAQFVSVWLALDVRPVLPLVQAPTVVIEPSNNLVTGPENGQEVARLIPHARLVRLEGDYAAWTLPLDDLAGLIEETVTGQQVAASADRMLASILFTDIAGSTSTAAALGDEAWRSVLDTHDAFVKRSITALGGRFVKSLGDGAMAVFDSPARAVLCGAQIVEGLRARGIEARAGLHTGECERRGDDVGGIAVHIASRVSALAQAGEVLVTGTVRDLVFGSALGFEDRGTHELRGVPGSWPILALSR